MQKEKLLLLTLAIIQFTHIVDFMIIMPLGSQFMEFFDISPFQFSLLVGSYTLSAAIAGFIGALYIDRFDRKQALLVLYIGFTAGTLVCAIAPTYEAFLAARALTGAFGGTIGAMVLAIVGDVIPLERRSAAMGWVMTAFSVASVAGVPAGIFLASEYGIRAPFLITGIFALLVIALIYYALPNLSGHLQKKTEKPASPLDVIRAIATNQNQRRALTFTVILMLGHFTIIPFIAPYMQINIGFSDHEVAYIYTAGGILTVFCMPIFGRLADRYGRFIVFFIASIAAVFSIFAITNLPPVGFWLGLAATSSFFIVASGRNIPATTLMTAVVKPENRGSFMSIRQSFNEGALFLGSIISGLIIQEQENGALLHYDQVGYFAIVMSIIAVLLARRLKAKY